MSRPNILYIHSHDTGRYIQPYGHAVSTPNLQTLAEDGVLFRQAFCASPTCSPSRACLLTGESAHNNGMIGLAHRGFSMKDYGHHMVHTLRKVGYTSALAGIQHIADRSDSPWRTIGYDAFLGDHAVAHERACDFLEHAPDEPFFLSVGFFETHREFPELGSDDRPEYCMPPAPLPDTPEARADMMRFKKSARVLDFKVGMVLDALEKNGLAENTLVICTTDHGIAFPRMKCNLTDAGIGVMLIMRGPGGFTGGKGVDALVSHIDLFPTICDVIGIDPPDWLQGVSIIPVVRGDAEDVREEIYAEVNYHAAYEPQRCVRTKRWKYIRRFDDRTKPVLPNCDHGLSKDVWMAHGWPQRNAPSEALYDLIFDPNETHNLVGHEETQEVLAGMKARLEAWMRDTEDPLLKGAVQAPSGAEVNDADGINWSEKTRIVA